MDQFLEKWKKDKKFQTKIKLLIYTLFVVFVSIYALSSSKPLNSNIINKDEASNNQSSNNDNEATAIITINDEYKYEIKININDDEYLYNGTKSLSKETIEKIIGDRTTNYIYENNNYYVDNNGTYVITTKEDVYDVISYSYINLKNINKYLSTSTKESNQYLVYLKDILLGNDSKDYFVIRILDKKISIDYTPLMKEFDKSIEKYTVLIEIK